MNKSTRIAGIKSTGGQIARHRCFCCDKGVAYGNNVSPRTTRRGARGARTFRTMRVVHNGRITKVSVCTRCLAAGKVQRAREVSGRRRKS